MRRAIWKGAISFGLVTVPVGLYSATERAAELHFRLLHAKDASPVDYKRLCEAEGVEVPWAQIARGYEYTYYDEPYYLAPTGKPAAKAYALLREALARTERVGIGTIVLRQREHLAALAPTGNALVLATLRYAHEIRTPDALDLPAAGRADTRELTLARQLIDTLATEWDPARYRDTYRGVMLKVIEQKAKGEPITAPAPRQPARVVSLMDALQQSLKTPRRPPAKTAARRAARRSGRRVAKRVA